MVQRGKVTVANAGDSRCVLCRGGTAVEMSSDHKPDLPEELARIEQVGLSCVLVLFVLIFGPEGGGGGRQATVAGRLRLRQAIGPGRWWPGGGASAAPVITKCGKTYDDGWGLDPSVMTLELDHCRLADLCATGARVAT